ncbi:hypothetical protein HAX54_046739 [Datura stramonium]|uniref:Aminotransferase class I/classII large domain-containing protein n=1 Tax=Datura stramonium TaxID=4076 RepID=A0ABS8SS27_DATST|nr:hypothetical protein [Datura stramonium]
MGLISSMNNIELLSKVASNDGHGENSAYFDGWKAYEIDPFHPTQNLMGLFRMGLCRKSEWVINNQKASICTAGGAQEFKEIAIYQDYHGLPEFRNAVARFMEKVRGERVRFEAERIVMSGGATGAHELLAFVWLILERFDRDLRWRTGVQLFPVVCESSNDFKVTRRALEDAYKKAQESNITIKGLLLNNPSNPLGTILDKETLKDTVRFINEKNIHLVCDEIYAATPVEGFGVSRIQGRDNLLVQRRCNEMRPKMSSFGLVSTQTQYLISNMLTDEAFVEKFAAESRERLAKRHGAFTKGLEKVGISTLKSNAGLFSWMDLRRLLKENTFESEIELWRIIVNEVKLNVSPGCSFHCSEPGWFRVCFANMDEETMRVALTRIKNFVVQHNKGNNINEGGIKKLQKCRRSKLRLVISSFFDVFAFGQD